MKYFRTKQRSSFLQNKEYERILGFKTNDFIKTVSTGDIIIILRLYFRVVLRTISKVLATLLPRNRVQKPTTLA
jgi:hypothetical protein